MMSSRRALALLAVSAMMLHGCTTSSAGNDVGIGIPVASSLVVEMQHVKVDMQVGHIGAQAHVRARHIRTGSLPGRLVLRTSDHASPPGVVLAATRCIARRWPQLCRVEYKGAIGLRDVILTFER